MGHGKGKVGGMGGWDGWVGGGEGDLNNPIALRILECLYILCGRG